MSIPFIRTIILYIIVIFAIRLMGKRQVGEMQPTELVITILVSAVASVPMQNLDIPLLYGIVPVLTLISAEIFMSFLSLKIPRFRQILTGKPVLLISNGHINQKALKQTRLSVEDLQEALRLKDVFDISNIRLAQIETNGQLSILLKDKYQPLSADSVGIKVKASDIFYTVIADGFLNEDSLKNIGADMNWLKKQLSNNHIDIKEVFLMLSSNTLQPLIIKKEQK